SSYLSYTNSPPADIYTPSLHDALPIYGKPTLLIRDGALSRVHNNHARTDEGFTDFARHPAGNAPEAILRLRSMRRETNGENTNRSEEHTSELQSRGHLVCRLLLEKKNK